MKDGRASIQPLCAEGRGTRPAMLALVALGMLNGQRAPAQQFERVPDAAVVAGVPQGIFVGRSLLTGRAVCLLFLSDGRITRAIPPGGLEQFDWGAHRVEHERDTGAWEVRGGVLQVRWGDGGLQSGPFVETPTGIEYAGKRYWRPVTVELAALAGTWESSRGTALVGGEGIDAIVTLAIAADGAYRWAATTGGAVAGRAVANRLASSGSLEIAGATMSLRDSAGTVTRRTLLVAPGLPVTAFMLDGESFTRVR